MLMKGHKATRLARKGDATADAMLGAESRYNAGDSFRTKGSFIPIRTQVHMLADCGRSNIMAQGISVVWISFGAHQ